MNDGLTQIVVEVQKVPNMNCMKFSRFVGDCSNYCAQYCIQSSFALRSMCDSLVERLSVWHQRIEGTIVMSVTEFANLKSSKKVSASDRVANALSLAIHEHRLAPGTKLGEDEIGEIYSVSRTIVRSALQSLAHIQLVEIHRNRGAFVAEPSLKEAREVFEARELLEPRIARSASERAKPEDIELLKRHIQDEHDALAAADHGRALNLSGRFHIEISRMAEQETIARFIETLIARSSLIIALYWRRENALCESHSHLALVKAIADGDGDEAEALMRSHLVDLHSALDLRSRQKPSRSLKDALAP